MVRPKRIGRRPGSGKAQRRLTAGRVRMYSRKGFTKTEMAVALGISMGAVKSVFTDRPEIAAAWDEGQTQKVERLRDLQWRHAKRSVPMALHMSAHQLGEHPQSLVVHKPDEESLTMMTQLFNMIDGSGRGLPDPEKVRPALEYQPMTIDAVAMAPTSTAAAQAEMAAENERIAAEYGIDLDTLPPVPEAPDEPHAAPPSEDLVMPPRMKSLLPD
jgi:hypothetical protein